MNQLSYKTVDEKDKIAPSCPSFRIVFNEEDTNYFFDVAALELSEKENGLFPIIVCQCGYLGCGGAYVEVSNNGNEVIWNKLWFGQSYPDPEPDDELKEFHLAEGLVVKPPLKFDRQEYQLLIKQLLEELPNLKEENANYQRDLASYKTGDRFRM